MSKNKTKAEIQAELAQAYQRIAALETLHDQECENRFAKIFHASPAQMALTDSLTGRYIIVNEAFLNTLGYTREEVIGKTATELNLFADSARRTELLQRMAAQGYLRDEYVLVRAHSGELRHGIFNAEFIQTNGQKLLLTVMNDITAIKQAEERWQFALESPGDGLWDWNLQTNRVFYSSQWKAMLDFDEAEIGDSLDEWVSRVHPDDLADTMEKIEAHLSGKTPIYSSEHRIRGKDGTYLWVLDRGKVLEWTEDRKPLRVVGTHKNVTESKVMETKLRESEARFSQVFQANPAVQLIVSAANGKILDANKAFCEQTGYTPEELIGRTTQEINFWQTPVQQQNILQALRAKGHLHDVEIAFRTKTGDLHTLLLSFQTIEINHARYIVSSGVNISERKHAEQALRKSEQLYHSLIEMLDVSLCRWLPDTTLTYANEKYKKIFGVEGEAIGKKWLDFLPEQTRLTTATFYAQLAENPEVVMHEHPVTVEDGCVREFQWMDTPLLDEQGQVVEFQSVGLDIHERKMAENHLRENEARLQGILEAAPDAMLIVTPANTILMTNAQTEKIFGYTRQELIGLSVEVLIPTALRMSHRKKSTHFLADPRPITTGIDKDVFALRKNGETFPVEISLSFHQQIGGEGMALCSVREVSEQRRARELIAAQRDLARLINEPHTREEIWQASFQNALHVSGFDSGGLYLFQANTHILDLVYHEGVGEDFVNAVTRFEADSPNVDGVLQGRSVVFSAPDIAHRPHLAAEGLRSLAVIPIRHREQVLGCLNIASHTLEHPPEFAIQALEVIALEIGNIINHQYTEEALQTSQKQLRQALLTAHMGTWRWHLPTDRVEWSEEASQIFGISNEQSTFQTILQRFHPEDRAKLVQAAETAMARNELLSYEYRLFNPEQTMYWVKNYGHVEYDKNGTPIEITGLIQDITARKNAEQAIQANEEKYRGLMESLDSIVATVDAQGTFLYMNDLAATSLGGRATDLIGKTMDDLFPATYAKPQMDRILEVIHTNQALVFESQSYLQGRLRWYRISLQPIHDENGTVSHVLLNVTDIDDLKTTQQELESLTQFLEEKVAQRAAEYQDLYDHAPVGYLSLNAEGLLTAINQTALNWLGYAREELLGKPASNLYQIENLVAFHQSFEQFKSTGEQNDLETLALRKDGTTFPVMLNATAIYDENGQYLSSRSTMTDITQLKLAENELKRNVNFTNTLLDAVPTPVYYKNKHGQYLGCNHAFSEFTGKGRNELLGKTAAQLWPTHLAESDELQDAERMYAGTRQNYESTVVDKNGVPRPVISVKELFRDESGQIAGVVGAFVDITERKYAEDTLRLANIEMERAMRMKDEFLANMSHELRTPLNAILGLSESLGEQLIGPLNERQLYSLQTIETSGRHLLELINDILDLAKLESNKMTLELAPLPVQEVCEASLIFIKEAARKKHIRVAFIPDPAVKYLEADGRRLKQMLVNLLTNAVKFTPEGGHVELQVTGNIEKRAIHLAVRDTGIGIAPQNLSHLFQPFIQLDSGLNRQYEGTGLGLSLVANMAKLHGGRVTVESKLNEGSTFTIILPWKNFPPSLPHADAAPLQDTPAPTFTSIIGFGPIILIAEDDEANILTLSMFLQAKGFRTAIARNGYEVFEHARFKRPALILMNLQMPELDKLQAIQRLRQDEDRNLAKTPIIAITAFAMPEDRERAMQAGANEYMSKPVNLNHLAEAITRLI